MLGDFLLASLLSTVSTLSTSPLDESINVYVQNLAEFPGESHCPSPQTITDDYTFLNTSRWCASHASWMAGMYRCF
jgi:hypothetical protein